MDQEGNKVTSLDQITAEGPVCKDVSHGYQGLQLTVPMHVRAVVTVRTPSGHSYTVETTDLSVQPGDPWPRPTRVATPAITAEPRSAVAAAPTPAATPTVERFPVSSPPTVTPRPRVATVAGDWLFTNHVRAGPGSGTQVTFRVRLTQAGATVTGTGDLALSGQLEGATLRATYTHPTGSGEVVWSFSADGTGFTGTFTNTSLGNRGDSLGRRWAAATPAQVVSLFYTLLSDRRYEDAYALLSPRFQAQQPWPRWRAGYTTTLAVVIEAVDPVSDSPPTVAVRVLATDLIDGRQVVRRFAGTWTLIGTADGWKLDVGRIQVAP